MKKIIKKYVNYIIIFIFFIAVFVLSLSLVALIPSKLIKENVLSSATTLCEEGQYYTINAFNKYIIFDNYTDSIMINNAYSMDSTNPLESALIIKRNYIPGITTEIREEEVGDPDMSVDEPTDLLDTVNGVKKVAKEYSKYWHGYLVYLKPLLIFFNYKQIRIIQLILLIILTLILLILIYKKMGIRKALIFLICFLIVDMVAVFMTLEYTPIFILMLSISIFLILRYEKIKDIGKLFFISGILACFFDFLTAPIITLGIPLIIYLLLEMENKDFEIIDLIKIFMKNSILWALGYVLTWVSKFLLVDLIYNKGLIINGFKQVYHRTIGITKIKWTFFDILEVLIEKCNTKIFIIIFILQIIRILLLKANNILINKKKLIIITLVTLLPLVWFFILKEHSLHHIAFTYRSLLVFWVGILIIMDTVFEDNLNKK